MSLYPEDHQKGNELPFEQPLPQRPNPSKAEVKGTDITRRRAALSAAFGVLAVVLGTAAVATWLAGLAPGATFPVWPAWTLTALMVVAVCVSFAFLGRRWPIRRSGKNGEPASVDFIPEQVGDHLRLGLVNQGPATEFSAQVTSIRDPMGRREAPQYWTIPWLEDNSAEPKRILTGGTRVLDFARYDADAVNAELGTGNDGADHWRFSAVPTPIGARYYNLRSQNDLELQRFILNVRIMNASSGKYLDRELTVRVQGRSLVCEVAPTGASD